MYFSASQKSFLPAALKGRYESVGTWPADAVSIPSQVHEMFRAAIPAGKVLGATPEGYPTWIDAPALAAPVFAEVAARLERYIQQQLDTEAQAVGYDSIQSAVSYADEPAVAKFQAEGQAFRAWRSKVWDACYQWVAAANGDAAQLPVQGEVMALLPALVLPTPTVA